MNRPWKHTFGDDFLALLRQAIPYPELRHESLMPTARALSLFLPWEAPDAAAVDMLVSFMDGRTAGYSQATFLAAVAELELNQTHIGLVGLASTGVEYA